MYYEFIKLIKFPVLSNMYPNSWLYPEREIRLYNEINEVKCKDKNSFENMTESESRDCFSWIVFILVTG